MALIVCFFGIMNAMLMSVTERFKEIGTMKCLGALNRFVVTLFFIEAGLMGVIASFVGWLIGWLIIVVIHLFSGVHGFPGNFLVASLVQAAKSVSIGVFITLLAAIPPAVRAAQMPPPSRFARKFEVGFRKVCHGIERICGPHQGTGQRVVDGRSDHARSHGSTWNPAGGVYLHHKLL